MKKYLPVTLSLYISRHLIAAFAAWLSIIVGLVLLFDILELLRRTSERVGFGFGTVLSLALLKMPHTVQEVEPFVVMLAMMYALFRLARNSELMVMRAAGVSVWQLLLAPMLLALALGVGNVMYANQFAAQLYESYQHLEDDLVRTKETTVGAGFSGLWMREAHGTLATIIRAAKFRQAEGVLLLTDVTVFKNDGEKPIRRFEAAEGRFGDGVIVLSGVWDLEISEGKLTATFRQDHQMPTTLTVSDVQDSLAPPETMSLGELDDFIGKSRESGFSALPHRLYRHAQFASPFLLASMVLVAAAAYLTLNAKAVSWVIRGVVCLGAGFGYYFINRFAYALGLSAALPPIIAAWTPTLIVAMSALGYLLHSEDG